LQAAVRGQSSPPFNALGPRSVIVPRERVVMRSRIRISRKKLPVVVKKSKMVQIAAYLKVGSVLKSRAVFFEDPYNNTRRARPVSTMMWLWVLFATQKQRTPIMIDILQGNQRPQARENATPGPYSRGKSRSWPIYRRPPKLRPIRHHGDDFQHSFLRRSFPWRTMPRC